MGVSLDTYRARIGSYVRHSHDTIADRWFCAPDDLSHLTSLTAGSGVMHQVVLSISPKLASLLLLMTVLSAQCHAYLLIMGSVEQNPGPAAATPVDVLTRLSAEAPSPEIRDCIRLYDQERDYTSNKKKLGAMSVATLVATMAYLGVPGQDIYTKPTVIHNLICRIQNLLPETCPICSESYCVKKDELELLPCAICGQACHTPCLLGLLEIPEGERSSFGPDEAKKKINPYNLPGIFYICNICEDSHIPSEEAGKRKKVTTQSATAEAVASEESVVGQQPVTPEDAQSQSQDLPGHTNNSGGPENPPILTPHQHQSTNQGQTNNNNNHHHSGQINEHTNPKQVCPFYRKGTCRHGISGRGCPRLHPSACRKLLTHGNKGPRGCTRGSQCDKFHPKMCPTSLKNGECLRESCKLRHVKGTRRVPLVHSDVIQRSNREPQNIIQRTDQEQQTTLRERKNISAHSHQVDFLAAIAALKTELLEAVDLKLRVAQSAAAGQASTTMANPSQQHLHHQICPCARQGVGMTCKMPIPSTLVH